MILLKTRILLFGRKRRTELIIESSLGAFLLKSFDSILLMLPGVEYSKNLVEWILGVIWW